MDAYTGSSTIKRSWNSLRVVRELSQGNAGTVLPGHAELVTQDAADLLKVSRPYLIGLIEQDTLFCTCTAGNHCRLRLTDVLTYKRARDTERRAVLLRALS